MPDAPARRFFLWTYGLKKIHVFLMQRSSFHASETLDSLAASGVLKDKRVLIRSDLNVPRNDEGAITNDARIVASLPAIKTALLAGAAVMVDESSWAVLRKAFLRPEEFSAGRCRSLGGTAWPRRYQLFRIGSTALR